MKITELNQIAMPLDHRRRKEEQPEEGEENEGKGIRMRLEGLSFTVPDEQEEVDSEEEDEKGDGVPENWFDRFNRAEKNRDVEKDEVTEMGEKQGDVEKEMVIRKESGGAVPPPRIRVPQLLEQFRERSQTVVGFLEGKVVEIRKVMEDIQRKEGDGGVTTARVEDLLTEIAGGEGEVIALIVSLTPFSFGVSIDWRERGPAKVKADDDIFDRR